MQLSAERQVVSNSSDLVQLLKLEVLSNRFLTFEIDVATRSSSSPLYNALSSRSLVSFPSAVQLSRIVSGMLARDVKWRGMF